VSAKVVVLADRHITRAEIRRAQALASITRALNAIRMLTEHNIPTLGDKEAGIALEALAERLDHEQARMLTLAEEYRELAAAALDEGSE
jgi:hypothetical protein